MSLETDGSCDLIGERVIKRNSMSEDSTMFCCASCGIAEVDDIKLVSCGVCDLVKYCSDECQQDHQSEHEEACIERAAELREELLFKQPESTHLGDCPICFLPLPFENAKCSTHDCCSKEICMGCIYGDVLSKRERRLKVKCPFCWASCDSTEQRKRRMKRIEANDPMALCQEGNGEYKKGNYNAAFEHWTRAAELGHVDAHYRLALLYHYRHGVEKDEGKEMYHLEEAAIAGHPNARYHLGCEEWIINCNSERAVKHYIIAATQGEDESIKMLMDMFKRGFVSKEDLAVALRAHQAAVDAMKSPNRDAVEELGLNNVE